MNRVAARFANFVMASAFCIAAVASPAFAQPNVIEAQSVSWGGHSMLGASDRKVTVKQTTRTDDIGEARKTKDKPSIGEISVTKGMDQSSSKLFTTTSGGGTSLFRPAPRRLPLLAVHALRASISRT